jgi:hypothetical protein
LHRLCVKVFAEYAFFKNIVVVLEPHHFPLLWPHHFSLLEPEPTLH